MSSKHLSGFRKWHSCQSVLLNLAIDPSHVYGILLTDLSKAFERLPYQLAICQVRAYGLGPDSCKLINISEQEAEGIGWKLQKVIITLSSNLPNLKKNVCKFGDKSPQIHFH